MSSNIRTAFRWLQPTRLLKSLNEDDEDVIYLPAVAYYNAILHIILLPFVRSNNNSLNLLSIVWHTKKFSSNYNNICKEMQSWIYSVCWLLVCHLFCFALWLWLQVNRSTQRDASEEFAFNIRSGVGWRRIQSTWKWDGLILRRWSEVEYMHLPSIKWIRPYLISYSQISYGR